MFTHYLLEDVRTIANTKKKPYGLKGEQVRIHADHGNVVIVEGRDSEKFAVSKDVLKLIN